MLVIADIAPDYATQSFDVPVRSQGVKSRPH